VCHSKSDFDEYSLNLHFKCYYPIFLSFVNLLYVYQHFVIDEDLKKNFVVASVLIRTLAAVAVHE
jgi:hypothetical protein